MRVTNLHVPIVFLLLNIKILQQRQIFTNVMLIYDGVHS